MVIIDLETFIQQPNSFNDDVLNEKINYEFDSVKRTLLLESRLRQNDVNEGIDISAINGKGYVMDEVLVPINMYTDMVRYEKQRVQIKGAKNLPFSEKYSRNVKKYINEILTGFSYVYDAFLELKDDSCFRDVIKKFSGVQVRHIIRNTDQYDTILRHSMHPEHLMDMLDIVIMYFDKEMVKKGTFKTIVQVKGRLGQRIPILTLMEEGTPQNIFSTLMAGAYDYLEIAKSSEEYRKKIEDVARWNWYLGKYGLKET